MLARTLVPALAACSILAGHASAANEVFIDITGVQLRNATNQTRTSSPATIDAAFRYNYSLEGVMVRGVGGLLGILYPTATSLETVLAALGGGAFTTEAVLANPTGELPAVLVDQTLAGQTTQLGVTFTFSADLTTGIDAAGLASFSFTNVSITSSSPLLQPGYLQVTTGSVHISVGCVADYDLDGGVTAADIGAFFADFEQGLADADVDGSGGIDGTDIGVFFQHFEAGC